MFSIFKKQSSETPSNKDNLKEITEKSTLCLCFFFRLYHQASDFKFNGTLFAERDDEAQIISDAKPDQPRQTSTDEDH